MAAKTIEQRNFYHLVMDIAWFGVGLAATTRFLSIYAIRLGATETDLMWLASLPALTLALSTGLGGWWIRRYPDSIRALFWPALVFRLVFFMPALAPFFPVEWRLTWLIVSSVIPAFAQGIAGVVFLVMMRQAVNDSAITALLSRRSLALNVAIGAGAAAFGYWLEIAPFPINYQVMFLVAFIFALFSQSELIGIRLISRPQPQPQPVVLPVQDNWLRPWRSPAFRRVALVSALAHAAFFAIVPITPLHLVNNLNADEWFMGQFGLAELAAGALISTFGGPIVMRFGNRTVIGVAMMGTALAAAIIALSPNLYLTLIAAVISGASWTLAGIIGLFGFFIENTPKEDVVAFSVPYHQILGIGMFAGPILGRLLAGSGGSLVVVLLGGALFRFVAGVVIHTDFYELSTHWRKQLAHVLHRH